MVGKHVRAHDGRNLCDMGDAEAVLDSIGLLDIVPITPGCVGVDMVENVVEGADKGGLAVSARGRREVRVVEKELWLFWVEIEDEGDVCRG